MYDNQSITVHEIVQNTYTFQPILVILRALAAKRNNYVEATLLYFMLQCV
jgi:hypothetical protein